jgi:hypothetical protein
MASLGASEVGSFAEDRAPPQTIFITSRCIMHEPLLSSHHLLSSYRAARIHTPTVIANYDKVRRQRKPISSSWRCHGPVTPDVSMVQSTGEDRHTSQSGPSIMHEEGNRYGFLWLE